MSSKERSEYLRNLAASASDFYKEHPEEICDVNEDIIDDVLTAENPSRP